MPEIHFRGRQGSGEAPASCPGCWGGCNPASGSPGLPRAWPLQGGPALLLPCAGLVSAPRFPEPSSL